MGTTINSHRRLGYPNHQQQSRRTPVKMRTYDDTFSGEKIYPGKGKLYVRGDSKIFRFQNGKTESKEKKAAQESKKKAEKAKTAAKTATDQVRGGLASKQQAKGKPGKVQATS